MISELKPQSRLHGVSIFLSASVPTHERSEEYDRIPEAPLLIEEAVVCIARAVFIEGGTLVFGAHPSISPLVARVVEHYYLPAPAEETVSGERREIRWKNPSVVIYQSRVWQEYWAEATEQLTRHHLVHLEWTDAAPGETVNPLVKDRPQAPKSMERMRHAMINESSPAAMIAIGGMKGVIDEAALFAELRPGKPIFTLATTGGAAALLSKQERYSNRVRVMDSEAESLVRDFWEKQQHPEDRERSSEARWRDQPKPEEPRKYYVPYAFVAQQIVEEVVKDTERHSF